VSRRLRSGDVFKRANGTREHADIWASNTVANYPLMRPNALAAQQAAD
jgi:hypothetical protein